MLQFHLNASLSSKRNRHSNFPASISKFLVLLFFTCLCILSTGLYSQSFTFFDSPVGFEDRGYLGEPIEYNGELYLRYHGNSRYGLAKFDGSSIQLIPSPTGFTNSGEGYFGRPIVFDNKLFLKYVGNGTQNQYVSYDGNTLNSIANPTNFDGYLGGYSDYPFIFNNKLYSEFRDNSGNIRFMEYDGSSFMSYGLTYGYIGSRSFEYNGKFYGLFTDNGTFRLGEFDGSNLTLLANPTGFDNGYRSPGFVFNGKAYLKFKRNDDVNSLIEYDGLTFTEINAPSGFDTDPGGYSQAIGEFNGYYYLSYRDINKENHLVRFDGTNLSVISNPAGYSGVREAIEYDNKLYFFMDNGTDEDFLAEYDGTSINIILPPSGYDFNTEDNIVYHGKLYLQLISTTTYEWNLGMFDGTNVTVIPLPPGYELEGYRGSPIIYNDGLYLQFETNNEEGVLAKFDDDSSCPAVTDLYMAGHDLIDAIKALSIPKPLKKVWRKKINKAGWKYCAGKVNSTLWNLNWLINQIDMKRGGVLTNEEADDLICRTQAIIDAINDGTADGTTLCNGNNSRLANPALSTTMETYPNPFNNALTIVWEEDPQEVNISLINLQGQTVFTMNMLVKGEHTLQIPDLPAGMYILNVEGEGVFERIKLLKN